MQRRSTRASASVRLQRPMLRFVCALAIACGCSAFAGPALAQDPPDQPGRVTGRVLDATGGETVEGALIRLTPGDRTAATGPEGTFAFADVPVGSYQLRVTHLGYAPQTAEVEVASRRSSFVEIPLQPEAIEVEPIDVRVERRPIYLEEVGFYDRLEEGWGEQFNPGWVETRKVGYTRADQFVAYVQGRVPSLGCSPPPVYVDGRRIMNEVGGALPNNLLREMSTYRIGAVEVFSTGHGLPLFAVNDTTLACGAILLWSDRWGAESGPPQIQVELCEPAGREGPITLEGVVRDELTGVRLPGAYVTLETEGGGAAWQGGRDGLRTIADRDGRYRYCDLDAAPATARARYGDETGPATPVAQPVAEPEPGGEARGAETPGRIALDLEVPVSRPGQITGRVLDGSNRRPLDGAEVTLPRLERTAHADRRGYFRLREVPPGDHELLVRHRGQVVVRRTVSVLSGKVQDLELEVQR